MTETEAWALVPGDVLLRTFRLRVTHHRVITVEKWGRDGVPRIHTRQILTGNGRRGPLRMLYPWQLQQLIKLPPPTTANVFADWLEEVGEAGAAAKLRRAFPLARFDE